MKDTADALTALTASSILFFLFLFLSIQKRNIERASAASVVSVQRPAQQFQMTQRDDVLLHAEHYQHRMRQSSEPIDRAEVLSGVEQSGPCHVSVSRPSGQGALQTRFDSFPKRCRSP